MNHINMKTKNLQKCEKCPVVCDKETMRAIPVFDRNWKKEDSIYLCPKHSENNEDVDFQKGGLGCKKISTRRYNQLVDSDKKYFDIRHSTNEKNTDFNLFEKFVLFLFFGFAIYGIVTLVSNLVA